TVNEQIGALRGATSPRLLLEILCAHLVMEPTSTDVAAADAPATGPAPSVSSSAGANTHGQSTGQPGTSAASAGNAPSRIAVAQQAAAAIAARRNQQRDQAQQGAQSPSAAQPRPAQAPQQQAPPQPQAPAQPQAPSQPTHTKAARSEEHTSELQSRFDLVCRLLLEK